MLKKYRGTNVIPEETGVFSDSDSEPEEGNPETEIEKADGNDDMPGTETQNEQSVCDESEFQSLEDDHRQKEHEVEREENLVVEQGLRRRPKKRVDPDFEYY
jgi:hypothetical protein